MTEFDTFMNYGDGMTVRGAPGLFFPADKAKVETMWDRLMSDTLSPVDITYAGDVEGYTQRDASGNVVVSLTVTDLEAIKETLVEMAERISELEAASGSEAEDAIKAELTLLQARLDDLTSDMESLAEEQLNYVRGVEFDTTAGALSFVDGSGVSTFTVGGATWDIVEE